MFISLNLHRTSERICDLFSTKTEAVRIPDLRRRTLRKDFWSDPAWWFLWRPRLGCVCVCVFCVCGGMLKAVSHTPCHLCQVYDPAVGAPKVHPVLLAQRRSPIASRHQHGPILQHVTPMIVHQSLEPWPEEKGALSKQQTTVFKTSKVRQCDNVRCKNW